MQLLTLAALAAAALPAAAKDERTFAVLQFTNKALTVGRMDPIASPGKASAHSHNIMGGSNFHMSVTGEELMKSECTNARIKGDNSAYWVPTLYFRDPETGEFEDVELNYMNVYYFFEPTNDDIVSFPVGLSMLSGDPDLRTLPEAGVSANQDPSQGPINPARWTCPRLHNDYTPRSWHPDSDGSLGGIGDKINLGEGVGFPDMTCDGDNSPLRADVHFPSCYDPSASLTDHKNNMVWPTDAGEGKKDCPEGFIHVPHLFFETYWHTLKYKGRWDENKGEQPFVLSNGDATGYSSHGDFIAAWDEELLQHIIDTCNAGSSGMVNCEGLKYGLNEEDCTIPSEVDEQLSGPLSALPGSQVIQGWSYGTDKTTPKDPEVPKQPSKPETTSASKSENAGLPDATDAVTEVAENPTKPTKSPETPVDPNEEDEPIANEPTSTVTRCTARVHTVYETVTVTADLTGPTAAANATESIDGFVYAGCFKDSSDRVLTGKTRPNLGQVTNAKCIASCKEAGFVLAGTEHAGECYCGNELVGSKQIDASECSMACKGDSEDTCGGDWALSVYSVDGEVDMQGPKAKRHLAGHLHGHSGRRS